MDNLNTEQTNTLLGIINIREKAFYYFIQNELYIRTLGNVIFINPPYSTTKEEMNYIHQKVKDFINQL